MSFADLETRVNAACIRRLSNARALKVGAAQDFPVIFDHAQVESPVGAVAQRPVFEALDSDLADLVVNQTQYVIDAGTTYIVRDAKADGTGMSMVVLEAIS